MRRITPLAIVFAVAALACIPIAVVYFTTNAADLPSFFLGHVPATSHAGVYTKRGFGALAAALVFFVIALLALRRD